MTEIENDFIYTIAFLHRVNILDNNIDTIQCEEVISIKATKHEKIQDISERELSLAPQIYYCKIISVDPLSLAANVFTHSKNYINQSRLQNPGFYVWLG